MRLSDQHFTVSEITRNRSLALRDARRRAEAAWAKVSQELQAEVDEIEREYRNAMDRNLRASMAGERKAA